jgi:hypothetical protein
VYVRNLSAEELARSPWRVLYGASGDGNGKPLIGEREPLLDLAQGPQAEYIKAANIARNEIVHPQKATYVIPVEGEQSDEPTGLILTERQQVIQQNFPDCIKEGEVGFTPQRVEEIASKCNEYLAWLTQEVLECWQSLTVEALAPPVPRRS